jgi:chromate transporter
MRPAAETFLAFLRLGLTSFGGPVAHVGRFRREFVERRRWMDDAEFADTVALCQFLPGPTSSQVGFAIGLRRAGMAGGLAAWTGFTAPSAVALGITGCMLAGAAGGWWLRTLEAVAILAVTHALVGMMRSLAPTAGRAALAVAMAFAVFAAERSDADWRAFTQPAAILAGAAIGAIAFRAAAAAVPARRGHAPSPVPRAASALAAVLFAGALALTAFAGMAPPLAQAGAACVRAGAMVFGGGHVVLPLLQEPFVAGGWLGGDQVVAGYALAQAVPGPLFTMASYLGAAMQSADGPLAAAQGAAFLTAAIFLPGLLIVLAALPAWDRLRAVAGARAALTGANCAVIGILAAALAGLVLRVLG